MKVYLFPLTKITLWFVLGILVSFFEKPDPQTTFVTLGIVFVLFSITYLLSVKELIPKVIFGILVYAVSFFIGITTQVVHTDHFQKNNYTNSIQNYNQRHLVELVLREKLKSTAFANRYIALVKKVDGKESSGKIIINFYKSKATNSINIGSNVKIFGYLVKHKPNLNPDQFDYGKYLTQKSIATQLFVNANEVAVSSKMDTGIWYISNQLREKIINNLSKSGFNKGDLNVVAALILGQQQEISPEILHDYQFAGAIHVLSVSGLHVGFLLLFITFLLKPLPKNKWGAAIKLSSVLLSLWGFAIIAGLSPSVVRSVTMFSFVAVGMHLKRKTNVFHTLLVSIYFILLFQPDFLFDVGFQLSYISLFFILWLQPLFSGIWLPKNKITQYFWDIITVSFAAQIGAMPLSIYYFHQFPGLFFITNLIILPGLGLIMALGVFVLFFATFDLVPLFFSKALEWSVHFLNTVINWIASFEQFIIKDISCTFYMLVSLYFLIIMVVIWFKKPSYSKIILAVFSIIIFQFIYFETVRNKQKEKEFVVFNIKKNTVIGFRNGKTLILYATETFQKNKVIQPYLVANFAILLKTNTLQNVLYFNHKKIVVIDSSGVYPVNIRPNIVLLSKSPKINLERFLLLLQPDIVVADASNYKSNIKVWKATCLKAKIPFHATAEKGFYRIN